MSSLNSDGFTLGTSTTTVSGSAPSYMCRAWCHKYSGFDGQGNGIAQQGNVSSLTQQSTGRWSVNYSTAMTTAYHVAIFVASRSNSDGWASGDNTIRSASTSTCVMYNNMLGGRYDFAFAFAAFC